MILTGSAKLHKKFIATFLILLGCALVLTVDTRDAFARPHIVVDAETGKILSHNRAHRRWAPASLTKLMTTYVTFRAIKLQQINLKSPVTVSVKASRLPPSKMGFPPGTVLTIDQAIKIIMVKSANDVAMSIGESVAGSEGAFVALMNSHARRLGMDNTQFRNPHGLPNKAQFTTAADMAKLGIAIQKEFPEYKKYLKVPGIVHGRRRMRNFNRLLTRFSGTTGMKTGYVCASGYNVIVSAERKLADGAKRKLITVVMGQTSGRRRNAKAAELLYKGFQKGRQFGKVVLTDFEPKTAVNPKPADITDETCRRKKRSRKKNAASIKNLEARYMSKPFDAGKYHKIVLGGATGPNPHAYRFRRTKTKTLAIPLPTKRPPLVCPVFAHNPSSPDGLQKIAAMPTQSAIDEKAENPIVDDDVTKSDKIAYPTPTGCLPVPQAKKDAPEPTQVLVASKQSEKTVDVASELGKDNPEAALASSPDTDPKRETDTKKVAQAFDIFKSGTFPIPTRRVETTYLTSFVAAAQPEDTKPVTRKIAADPTVKSEPNVDPAGPVVNNQEADEVAIKSLSEELPTKPEKTLEVIAQDAPKAEELTTEQKTPKSQIAVVVQKEENDPVLESDTPKDDEGELVLASLPPEFTIVPSKRPSYKASNRTTRVKSEKAKKTQEAKPAKKSDDEKTKKPVRNGFAKNLCRVYRNSGCFPELGKTKKAAKKSTKKTAAGAKKVPGHCPALQSLYRQNRKNGLDCRSG